MASIAAPSGGATGAQDHQPPTLANHGYLDRLLTSNTDALNLQHLQRSDMQLLLNARGLPIYGPPPALRQRLASAIAEETNFKWSIVPHVAWAPKREWPLVFAHAGSLYMLGGRETTESDLLLRFCPEVGRFQPAPIHIETQRFPAMLTCSTCLEFNGRLWLFGGRAETPGGEIACINDMFCFDITTSKLTHIEQQGPIPHPREGAAAVEWQDFMLLYGGVNLLDQAEQERFEARSIVPVFHMPSCTWSHWHTSGTLPEAEETVEATALYKDFMYTLTWSAAGGFSMFRLDLPRRKWSRVVQHGTIPQPRCEFTAVQWQDSWVVHGGYLRQADSADWEERPCGEVFRFRFETHEWEAILTDVPLLPRGQHQACLWRDTIIIAGGHVLQRPNGQESSEDDDEEILSDHVEALTIMPTTSKQRHSMVNTDMSQSFRTFFNSPAHSDVVLRCSGQEFYAHRLVLAVQSKTFDRMLQTQMREGASGQVDIDGVQPEVLASLLKYIYGCQEDITPATVVDLFRAADHYQVEGLRAECLDLMRNNIDVNNCAALAALADGHELPDLLEHCIKFAATPDNITQVVGSAAYLELVRSHPELAQQFTMGLLTGHTARGGVVPVSPSPNKTTKRKRSRR